MVSNGEDDDVDLTKPDAFALAWPLVEVSLLRYERLSALSDAASGLSHMHNSNPEAFHRVAASEIHLLFQLNLRKFRNRTEFQWSSRVP